MLIPFSKSSMRLGALAIIAALAACSGGSVATTPIAQPVTNTQTVATSTTASTTVAPVTVNGISAVAVLPPTNNGATITETSSVTSFSGTPALGVARVAQSTRTTQSGTNVDVLYFAFSANASTTLAGSPGLSITLPAVTAGASYYLATYGANGWVAPTAGPGTVNGTTVTFAITAGSITISPTAPLLIVLYSTTATASPTPAPSASASPSARPSASPTPTPSPTPTAVPTPVAQPSTLTFDATAPTTQPFIVTETNDTAAFTAAMAPCTVPSPSASATPTASPAPSSTPAFVARLATTSATPGPGGATFSVVSGSLAGTCIVTVTDARGATVPVTVNVDQSQFNIFSTHRATP